MPQRFEGPHGRDVVLVSTVQGLVSERDTVRAAFEETKPAALALGVSPENVAALMRYAPSPDFDPFDDLPDSEWAFSAALSRFGPVDLPPPDLMEALRLAKETGVPAFGVDLTEEQYEDVFTTTVGTFSMLRYGRVQRKLAKRPPKASDPRAFSLAWDARVRRVKKIGLVEAAREEAIARGARAVAADAGGVVLLVVDAAREAGVARLLAAPDG